MKEHTNGLSTTTILLVAFVFLPCAVLSSRTPLGGQPLSVIGEEVPDDGLETYIIHVRKPPNVTEFVTEAERLAWHGSFLPPTALSDTGRHRLVHSYDTVMSGFAAVLTREELAAVERKEGFLYAQRDRLLELQTTYSPQFLGLQRGEGLWDLAKLGEGIIIGVLDTGIYPNHPSFRDDGRLPPPPRKWKGKCGFRDPRLCNNKLIGAVSVLRGDVEVESPLDTDGHGTHVAGTAAGMFSPGAEVLGQASGVAAGTAPHAHLAVYKVCATTTPSTPVTCRESDALAGIQRAIDDGVDVISMSIGWPRYCEFYDSPIAIGSLAAIQRGIFVSCAGGNSGPQPVTVVNDAPWVLTVGASTMDRAFRAVLNLEKRSVVEGEALYQPSPFIFNPNLERQLSYPGGGGDLHRKHCLPGSLEDNRGKMVICQRAGAAVSPSAMAAEVRRVGGVAMILMNQEEDGYTIRADDLDLPAIGVSFADSQFIPRYSWATLGFSGTVYGAPRSPAIASFSSRGPSWANDGGVLKPDVVGPGLNILAASPPRDSTTDGYSINWGTSMATPHLSGIAALLRKAHGGWSPAAIKSAIMTTADLRNHQGNRITDQTGQPANGFDMGAGHVNPTNAADPGLIYDLSFWDYARYLCTLGYTAAQIEVVAGRPVDCSHPIAAKDLNYPSFSAQMRNHEEMTLTRTVTNVGPETSVYKVEVVEPEGVTVKVVPDRLVFTPSATQLSFQVRLFRDRGPPPGAFTFGMLRWVSGHHVVSSPISVLFVGVKDNSHALPPCHPPPPPRHRGEPTARV